MRINFESHRLDQIREDYEFMKKHGESDNGAAARLGLTPHELQTKLESFDRRFLREEERAS